MNKRRMIEMKRNIMEKEERLKDGRREKRGEWRGK